jgi:hypothetical protein
VFLKPYELDLSRALRPGSSQLEILLTTRLHNRLEPHPTRHGEVTRLVHRHSFRDAASRTDDYALVPPGLTGAMLSWGSAAAWSGGPS